MTIEATPDRERHWLFSLAEPSAFTIFQYFLRVVPTTYIDAHRRRLDTSQASIS